MSGLRIALLAEADERTAPELQNGLRAGGDHARILTGGDWPLIERRLERRGFEPGLSRLPSLYRSLSSESPQLVHAFGVVEAAAAAWWAGRLGRPLVLSLTSPVERPWIVERRMRLSLLLRAALRSRAILVPSPRCAELLRWELGLEAMAIEPGAGAAHHALYEQLIEPEES